MSIARIEKRFRYLEAKEGEMRNLFENIHEPMVLRRRPVILKDLLTRIKTDTQVKGFDPYKPYQIKERFPNRSSYYDDLTNTVIAFPKKNEAEENTKSSLGSTLKSNINNLSKSKNNLPPTIGVGFNPNHSKIISSHEAYLESLEYSINQEKDRFKNIVISQVASMPKLHTVVNLKQNILSKGRKSVKTLEELPEKPGVNITERDLKCIVNHLQHLSDNAIHAEKAERDKPKFCIYGVEKANSSQKEISVQTKKDENSSENIINIESGRKHHVTIPHEKIFKYMLPNFVYPSRVQTNIKLLQNEYMRDDFYSLHFQVIAPIEEKSSYTLKIIDLTSKTYQYILFENLRPSGDGYLLFDSKTCPVLNPKKKFGWISQIEDLIGNTLCFSLTYNCKPYLTKYAYLDHFSTENYAIALLEIANYSRYQQSLEVSKESTTELLSSYLPDKRNQGIESDILLYRHRDKLPKPPTNKDYMTRTLNSAFRTLLHRIEGNKLYSFNANAAEAVRLRINGLTVIEFKNCIVRVVSLHCFEILLGNVDELQLGNSANVIGQFVELHYTDQNPRSPKDIKQGFDSKFPQLASKYTQELSGVAEIGRINSTQFRNLGMEKRMKATKALYEQKVAEQFESRAFRTLSGPHLSGVERVKYIGSPNTPNRKGSKHSQKYRAPGRKSKSPTTSNKNRPPKDNNKLIGRKIRTVEEGSSGARVGQVTDTREFITADKMGPWTKEYRKDESELSINDVSQLDHFTQQQFDSKYHKLI